MTAACKSSRWQKLSRLPLLAAAALAMTACVDERAFFITGNFSECGDTGAGASGGAASLAGGLLDVSGGQPYYFFPTVRNDLQSTSQNDGEPERNILAVQGFEVDLDIPSGAVDAPTSTFTHASGIVEPNGGTISFTNVPILSRELVQALPLNPGAEALIVATIRARASHNGSTLKSVEFKYPINVCNGCLVTDLGDCPSTQPEGVVTNACGLPQDSPVVCCTQAASGQKVCLDQEMLDALPVDTGV